MDIFQGYAVQHVIYPSLVILFVAGGILAIVVGLGLILRVDSTLRLINAVNRLVSTQGVQKAVDAPRNMDQVLKRQRQLLGAAFIVGALLSAAVIIAKVDAAALASVFQPQSSATDAHPLATSVRWLLLVGDVLAILVGVTLIVFPNTLAKLEGRMNRWYSSAGYQDALDIMHLPVERWTEAHPRAAGWIMLVLGVFVLLNLGLHLLVRT